MRRVARDEDAALRIALRTQEMLRPFVYGNHLEADRHRERFPENLRHFMVACGGCVQCPMAGAVLQNNERKERPFCNMVMTPFAHRNSFVKFLAMKQSLPELSDVSLALELDAQLFANGARPAIAPGQIGTT